MNSFKKEKQPGAGFDATSFDDSQLPLQLKKIIDHLGFLEKKSTHCLSNPGHDRVFGLRLAIGVFRALSTVISDPIARVLAQGPVDVSPDPADTLAGLFKRGIHPIQGRPHTPLKIVG